MHIYASNHYKKTQVVFLRAIRKYGPKAFVIQEIDATDDKILACRLEMVYILLYQATNPELGYNGTFGGEGGQIPTPETRAKIGKARAGRASWTKGPNTAETVEKCRQGKLGSKNPNFGKPSPNRRSIPLDEAKNLYDGGMNTRQLADKYGVSQGIVCKRFREAGVKLRSNSESQKGPLSPAWGKKHAPERINKQRQAAIASRSGIPDEEIVRLYSAGYSAVQIADKFGCSNPSIYNRLKALQIPTRQYKYVSPKF